MTLQEVATGELNILIVVYIYDYTCYLFCLGVHKLQM